MGQIERKASSEGWQMGVRPGGATDILEPPAFIVAVAGVTLKPGQVPVGGGGSRASGFPRGIMCMFAGEGARRGAEEAGFPQCMTCLFGLADGPH
jgi:hypothetical protein